jgi:phosphatidylethanolamine/phosphatidyl-N-methylethanolamine N-methyltransferase
MILHPLVSTRRAEYKAWAMALFKEHRTFWREFRSSFHTTGAVLPSGKRLATKLARYVAREDAPPTGLRILEVGPGTGAVTSEIVRAMGAHATLDLVELNDEFVRVLGERFETDPEWRAVRDRTQIIHKPIEELPDEPQYDVIVSGLPLNNFAVENVRSILAKLQLLTAPNGTVSFFEYIAIRRVKVALSGREQRERLSGVGQALDELLGPYEFHRDAIMVNVPPAWVHHLRFDKNA